MSGWKKHFKPTNSALPARNSQGGGKSVLDKFSSWLPDTYQGPPNRLQRYAQYDQMDFDQEVHSALDTIAEFSTMPDDKDLPFDFMYNDEPSAEEVKILKNTLRQWCELNEFNKRIFKIFRSTLKYGDQVFIRDPETYKLIWVDPQTVQGVTVNESVGKIPEIYHIKNLDLNLQTLTATDITKKTAGGYGSSDSIFPNAPLTGQANTKHANSMPQYGGAGTFGGTETVFDVDAIHIIHMSLTEGMDDAWPFGVSILEKVFKIYKQKELLEDAILIYRIHRAPERRVFFIDTGTMPPERAQQYLERIRYEVQQKRIPSRTGGGENVMDSSYNPLSMLEDYFFAQSADGRGSKVEILPGGENLGEIDDLKYFSNRMFRGLAVPSSYLPTGPEDGTAQYNDGRIGSAFIQEFRFMRYCKRLQRQIVEPLDREFKLFLKRRGIIIDASLFKLTFNEPQNFQKYRQIEIDSAHASVFGQLADVPYISKRMLLRKYLGWDDADVLENEKLVQEESHENSDGIKDGDANLRQVGVIPGQMDDFSDAEMMDDDMADDLGDDTDLDTDLDLDAGPGTPDPENFGLQ